MARFRKLPIIIDTVRWDGTWFSEAPTWVGEAILKSQSQGGLFKENNELKVNTLEGTMTVSPGDWIIRGVKGELYPCKPDVFEATYERVET